MQKLPSLFVGCGLVFLLVAVILGWIVGPLVIEDQIIRNVRLENGSFIWNKWKDPTNVMFLKVYLFNVTNPTEVEAGQIPILQEIGPYTYRESRYKENIAYDAKKDTIKYTQPISYYFQEDLSSGLESDILTVINVPLVGVSQRLHTYPYLVRSLMGYFLEQYEESLFIQKTVRELLFDGYHSSMVEELQHLTGENFFPNAIVGLLVGRNNSQDGQYEIYSGLSDYSKFGQLASFNENTHLSAWPSEPCNMINGTEGSLLPPLITKNTVIRGFHQDVCRSLYVTYAKDIEYDGIFGYRFEPPEEQYLSPRKNLNNRCFCHNPKADFSNCFEDGVITGSACHKEAPVTISNPHFLYAPYYLNKTRGLSPDKKLHGLFVEFEMNSGLILRATRRMQINVDLKPNSAISVMNNVPIMQFPVVWVDETFYLDKEVRSVLLSPLILANTILEIGRWIFLGSSLALLGTAISINLLRARKKPYIYS